MPTNLKNLLSRSRSKNELKIKDSGTGEICEESVGNDLSSTNSARTTETHLYGNSLSPVSCKSSHHHHIHFSRENVIMDGSSHHHPHHVMRRESSCKSLFSFGTDDGFAGNQLANTKPTLTKLNSMRKSETVLALTNCTSLSNSNSPGVGRTKSMKDKFLSTSSHTLNNFLHSSTSKLFPGFKFASSPSSSNSQTKTISKATISSPVSTYSNSNNKNQLSSDDIYVAPLTPTNRLRKNWSNHKLTPSFCNTSLGSIIGCGCEMEQAVQDQMNNLIPCRLCLSTVKLYETVQLQMCSCRYCKDCMTDYISFEIEEGAYEIACPDSTCEKQGVLSLDEVEGLVCCSLVDKFKKFRLHREVENDSQLTWCPTPGCETICRIEQVNDDESGILEHSSTFNSTVDNGSKQEQENTKLPPSLRIQCSTCRQTFCAECKLSYHYQEETNCDAFRKKLIKSGKLNLDDEEMFNIASIKKCPFCNVRIEKDSGCAQMMCKRCKHVFCWYCLESLDDDFLLRHYDKGPCKNKLGHSRASVIWHRVQVVGIFAGFGILVLLASPLLILAAPCLLCCRCRYCSTKSESEQLTTFPHASII